MSDQIKAESSKICGKSIFPNEVTLMKFKITQQRGHLYRVE